MSAVTEPQAAMVWRRVLRSASRRLAAKRSVLRNGDWTPRRHRGEGSAVSSITYLRRAQIATANLSAGQLALIAHQAAGGRPREFQQRTGWSAARYRTETARTQRALRAELALDAAPAPAPRRRGQQDERAARRH